MGVPTVMKVDSLFCKFCGNYMRRTGRSPFDVVKRGANGQRVPCVGVEFQCHTGNCGTKYYLYYRTDGRMGDMAKEVALRRMGHGRPIIPIMPGKLDDI